jgi:hypothetical protein
MLSPLLTLKGWKQGASTGAGMAIMPNKLIGEIIYSIVAQREQQSKCLNIKEL